MSTQLDEPAVANADDAIDAGVDMVTTLDIGPGRLDRYLKLVGDRRNPLIKYHEGSLTLVSPSRKHERGADRIDDLIKAICDGLGIHCHATGSTLYRRPDMDHGIEADKSYYIANEPAVRDMVEDEIDLSVYPPPDLIVEAVATHDAKKSLVICRELGVPEVWVYRVRRRSLEFLLLDAQGQYQAARGEPGVPVLDARRRPPVDACRLRDEADMGLAEPPPRLGPRRTGARVGLEPTIFPADCHNVVRSAVEGRRTARLQEGTHSSSRDVDIPDEPFGSWRRNEWVVVDGSGSGVTIDGWSDRSIPQASPSD